VESKVIIVIATTGKDQKKNTTSRKVRDSCCRPYRGPHIEGALFAIIGRMRAQHNDN